MIGLEAFRQDPEQPSPVVLVGFEVVRWECSVAHSAGSGVDLELTALGNAASSKPKDLVRGSLSSV